jgi:UDP-3-O-[3-hydroxymyristoyl] glucosamine N-acyltransferase
MRRTSRSCFSSKEAGPDGYNASMKLSALAHQLGGVLTGDHDPEITGVAGIEEAQTGHLTFVANPKYTAEVKKTRASAVLVSPDFPETALPALRVKNPDLAFARAIEVFYRGPVYAPGIHPKAEVHPAAKIGARAHIGAYAVIGEDVTIGEDATILPHVVIYPGVTIGNRFFAHAHAVVRENCRLGDGVILQNGAVVGSDGFGFARLEGGGWYKIVQSGPAILDDEVEIQANACIDRARVGETHLHRGVKVDNLVQVGHGSIIGENSLLCSQTGLAGSTEIGRNVILAGQVGVAGHCKIGDGVIATAQAGLHGDIPAGSMLSGSPGFDNKQWLRVTAIMPRLPELVRQLQRVVKQMEKWAAQQGTDVHPT